MITPLVRFNRHNLMVNIGYEDHIFLTELAEENDMKVEDYASLLMKVALDELRSDIKELEAQANN